MESIQYKQNQIIDEFNFFEDWSEKYQYLIDLGKSLPEFDQSQEDFCLNLLDIGIFLTNLERN